MPGTRPGMTGNYSGAYMNRAFLHLAAAILLAVPFPSTNAAEQHEPYGIGLEGFAYPYPVSLLPVVNDGEQLRMAYMDVAPAQPNGRTVEIGRAHV